MKKGIIYYCLIASLIFHTLVVLLVRLDQAGKEKEKEPVAIDLVGPLKRGPRTRLPHMAKGGEKRTITPMPDEQRPARSAPSILPALPMPSFPTPAQGPSGQPAPQAPPAVYPGPEARGELPRAKPAPPARRQDAPGRGSGGPRWIERPSQEDMMRYAKVDREYEKSKDEDTITLDTEDLMYTSYLQGIRKRIELIWKYPETARRDGLQGNLVMRFSIGKSGKVEDIELLKSSGYPMLDEAARQALLDANPFNPLPDNWKKDSFTITGTFMYRLYGLYLR